MSYSAGLGGELDFNAIRKEGYPSPSVELIISDASYLVKDFAPL